MKAAVIVFSSLLRLDVLDHVDRKPDASGQRCKNDTVGGQAARALVDLCACLSHDFDMLLVR